MMASSSTFEPSSSDVVVVASSSSKDDLNDKPHPKGKGGYTPTQLRQALESMYGPNPEETCRHIYGYGDPEHELSMLQIITATRVLDYEKKMKDPSTPTEEELRERIRTFHSQHGPILNLAEAIQSRSPSMALAAEFKRASPSKGDIAPDNLRAGEQAIKYAAAGAGIVSVLTEPRWFRGSLRDLTAARVRTSGRGAPPPRPVILRKEFITSRYMISEAAAAGADTVLLIVAVLPADLLGDLIGHARSLRMEPLVEVHADGELDAALNAGARVIGVNNRNLHTFELDLATTDRFAMELKRRGITFDHNSYNSGGEDVSSSSSSGGGATRDNDEHGSTRYSLCALSGMSSAADVDRYRQLGVGMCLIGESLMRAADPTAAIKSLCLNPSDYAAQNDMDTSGAAAATAAAAVAGGAYTGGTKLIKVCGITNADDALVACGAGANLVGVIFAEKSKRRVTPDQARSVVDAVRAFGERKDRVSISIPTSDNMSPLHCLARKAHALQEAARRPLVVGVFQNQSPEFIRDMVDQCGLDLVQLHGNEGMKAASVENCGVPAIRVVDIETDSTSGTSDVGAIEKMLESLTSDPVAILLDTSIKGAKLGGGSGVTFDWNLAESVQNRGLPVIIAGGLKPENARNAVATIRPWGVDVSSRVEESPGIKGAQKVKEFVKGAREAAQEASKGF